jgi:hypothetical protein
VFLVVQAAILAVEISPLNLNQAQELARLVAQQA